jgi:hypothetical protein
MSSWDSAGEKRRKRNFLEREEEKRGVLRK